MYKGPPSPVRISCGLINDKALCMPGAALSPELDLLPAGKGRIYELKAGDLARQKELRKLIEP